MQLVEPMKLGMILSARPGERAQSRHEYIPGSSVLHTAASFFRGLRARTIAVLICHDNGIHDAALGIKWPGVLHTVAERSDRGVAGSAGITDWKLSQRAHDELRARGVGSKITLVEGAPHGFDAKAQPGDETFAMKKLSAGRARSFC
ncbi:hypothetical protein LA080_006220 [Diaporthe eres]|nr:hypothetical protein LA080_006220 [Diaporthe eres]